MFYYLPLTMPPRRTTLRSPGELAESASDRESNAARMLRIRPVLGCCRSRMASGILHESSAIRCMGLFTAGLLEGYGQRRAPRNVSDDATISL